MTTFLGSLGWDENSLDTWRSRTIRRRGKKIKVRFLTVMHQRIPYLLVLSPCTFSLPSNDALHSNYLDMTATQRMIIDNFNRSLPHTLLLFYDGHRAYLFHQPGEMIIAYSDSTDTFNEKILPNVRPELTLSPRYFNDIFYQRKTHAARELEKWIETWSLKLASLSRVPKESTRNFIHKCILWRKASFTALDDYITRKIKLYIIPGEPFPPPKDSSLPAASRDISAIFKRLYDKHHLAFARLTPEDVLIMQRTRDGKILCPLLRELTLLGNYKLSADVLAHYANSYAHIKSFGVRKQEETFIANSRRRKKKGSSYIIDMPSPHYVSLSTGTFTGLLDETRVAFNDLLEFRSQITAYQKKTPDPVLVQEDLFRHEQYHLFEPEELLFMLINHGIRVPTNGENLKKVVRFVLSGLLLELRYDYQIPTDIFPSLEKIFET